MPNEYSPLLVSDDRILQLRPPHRRSVWSFVLLSVFSMGALSFFQLHHSLPLNIANINTSFDATKLVSMDANDAAFQSSLEAFKDPSIDPCVDFYEYACGGWLQTHDIPSDRSSIDTSFYVASENNKKIIQQIFATNPPQIGPFYHSCVNADEVDATAIAFVTQLVHDVHQANSTLHLLELAGEMDQSLGISTFLSMSVGADPQDPRTNVLQVTQGGLTLPSREYYLEQSKVDAYAALYVDYAAKLFAVKELSHYNASDIAQAVIKIETALATMSLPNAALRDPWTTTTAYPIEDIAQRYPYLLAYVNGLYKHKANSMSYAIIATPTFFEAQNEFLSNEALLPQLKKYMSFHLLDSFGALLGESFRRASHDFHGKIQGARDLLPRDQFCVRLTTELLGEQVGKYYMHNVFGPDAKRAAQALVVEIEESLKALLLTEKWLDKITYDAAVEKLSKVRNSIGGPDDVPPLPFELQADTFFNNTQRLMHFVAAKLIQSIGKPVNEKAWDMAPSTVNAYYDPSANKMVFPAAILQPPFYSAEHFPAAANFARIGMVMGHELSHGFDDQGRNYDGNGALRSWWTPSVSLEFAEKAQCLVAQYSTFPVISTEDGHVLGTVNGNLTLGENIADNGGIRLAYEAYHLWKTTVAPDTPPEPVQSTPNDGNPVKTPPSILPIPEPTETEPGERIPVVTLPPPVIPVPKAEAPGKTPIKPTGEIPVATPPVVPEVKPADVGPGEEIPPKTTPAPELPSPAKQQPPQTVTEPMTEAPTMTPISSVPPASPGVPKTSGPPEVPSMLPQPTPSVVSPDETSKRKHKKEASEPSAEAEKEGHAKTQKRHERGSEGKKESGKSDSKEAEDKSRSGRKHSLDDADHDKHFSQDDGSSSKKSHRKDSEGSSERHQAISHHDDEGRQHEDAERQHEDAERQHEDAERQHEDAERQHEDAERQHEDADSERNTKTKHRHEKEREEADEHDKHKHQHGKSRKEDRDDHLHRNEEKSGSVSEDDHKGKHRSHEKEKDRENDGEKHRHGKHSDEDVRESDKHEHRKHESKEKRREERKEHKKEHHGHGKETHHHHDHGEDYDSDRESKHGTKHHHHNAKHQSKDEERHKCSKKDADCGSKRHTWALSKYPFSGGDARIHGMVEKLARAFVQPLDPIADDRLFFTAFAQNWCEKRTPESAELLRTIDPHAPGKWRVNGPLMNYHKFAAAFSCPVGTPMNPAQKCVIW